MVSKVSAVRDFMLGPDLQPWSVGEVTSHVPCGPR